MIWTRWKSRRGLKDFLLSITNANQMQLCSSQPIRVGVFWCLFFLSTSKYEIRCIAREMWKIPPSLSLNIYLSSSLPMLYSVYSPFRCISLPSSCWCRLIGADFIYFLSVWGFFFHFILFLLLFISHIIYGTDSTNAYVSNAIYHWKCILFTVLIKP